MANQPATLDINGVPLPPDPDPSSGNLAGITPEELAAERIAKYREALEPEPDETPVTRSLVTLTASLHEIRKELRRLREAVEQLERNRADAQDAQP